MGYVSNLLALWLIGGFHDAISLGEEMVEASEEQIEGSAGLFLPLKECLRGGSKYFLDNLYKGLA